MKSLPARREQIETWLQKDRLLLTKVHELLEREGLLVPYSSLHRFLTSGVISDPNPP